MKMLPLDGTSSVLDPSIGSTSLLSDMSVLAESVLSRPGSSNRFSKRPKAATIALSVDTEWNE